jgi:DNA-binding beta-propeller fold protein YncE
MYRTPKRVLVILAITVIALCCAAQIHAQRHLGLTSLEFSGTSLAIDPLTNLIYAPMGIGFDASVAVVDGIPGSPTFFFTIRKIDLPNDSFPVRIAVNPDTKRAYVLDNTLPRLTVLDIANNTFLQTIPLSGPGFDVAVNSATNRIYISQPFGRVVVVNSNTNTVETTIQLTYENANAGRIAINAATNRIYVTDPVGAVNVIDGSSNTVLATVRFGFGLEAVSVNPITNRIYVANSIDRVVTVIRGEDNTIEANVFAGFCRGVAANPRTGRVFVFTPGTGVAMLDGRLTSPTYNTFISRLDFGIFGWDSAVNTTTNIFYVANSGFYVFDDPISPQNGITALMQWVSSLNLAHGLANNLDSKLSNAQAALDSVKNNDASTACNKLDSFINAVQAQQDKGELSTTAVRELTTEAGLIKSALGCQ